jgi:hypothetical protein
MHAYDSGSTSGRGSLVRKPSFLMFRVQSKKNDQIRMNSHGNNEPIAFVPHPSLLGQVLGEVHFTFPQLTRDSKSSGTYTLVNGKKEVAKIFLKMGIYDDVQIIQSDVEKEIAKIPEMPEFSDFLNVLNESNMVDLQTNFNSYGKNIGWFIVIMPCISLILSTKRYFTVADHL